MKKPADPPKLLLCHQPHAPPYWIHLIPNLAPL
jgi:hypothetical protein